MKIKFECEDCLKTMADMKRGGERVNVILTSPPYNSRRNCKTERGAKNLESYYDVHQDKMTDEDYCNFVKDAFIGFDSILEKNGVIIWNVSYGNENPSCVWLSISYILLLTNFCIADVIVWKKKMAIPNNVSKNKLTRITELCFIIVRKSEYKTFQCNKKVKTVNPKTNQKFYENVYNFIEAANNDGICVLNRATFSSELVEKLLDLYAEDGNSVYDPFMGTGTTAIGCLKDGRISKVIGSEISKEQVCYSKKRVAKYISKVYNNNKFKS